MCFLPFRENQTIAQPLSTPLHGRQRHPELSREDTGIIVDRFEFKLVEVLITILLQTHLRAVRTYLR
jgi:hypothetical protein